MKRLLGAILLVTFLNGCSGLPLVSTLEGSLSINGAIATATGKYEHQAASALVNLASHNTTGKTISQHMYAAVENKYTEKRLKKHFKNKELSITNFEIANKSLNDFGGFLPKDKGNWFLGKKKIHVEKEPIRPYTPIHKNEPSIATHINESPVHYVKLTNYTTLDKFAPNFKHKIKQKSYSHCFKSSGLNLILNMQYCNKTKVNDIVF